MLAGELYRADDPELVAGRLRARRLARQFNVDGDMDVMRELLGKVGEGVLVEPPFHCDYGSFVEIGDRTFINFGCTILDCNVVRIGNGVQIATHVQLLCATHPLDAVTRAAGDEYALPITIGDKVWLGGGAIVLPGVTIGENSVVGAGAVVTKDVPPNAVAVGNPARVVREL